ncbi:nuclear matrix associated phosphoprotein [Condylorrhiza vestigialis mutiple nucleopolyhedrovirus]|uniref:Nuclear matrix associated phosphoprotein n=1 Tax=Condylorrhiza vestigialis mutiple nucleopolyhedrovirus TaxID=1592576 RepID=A0A0B4UL84_9ABAC|nr:nuclear matrix associated phosphoprotein [Condylorrhiza vestigialis mutiple nucleopolyhedrovirus]AJD09282.1 nuclear matrix associated phosphoprotein [Condylorrhiza vestigialis mutiple nucleopolyhedrovirus]
MVNMPETVRDESFASNNALLINKLENSAFNKSNLDYLKTCINYLEKKNINYTVAVLPCFGDDRKTVKRPKRVSNHNMYILFNSFYTKIRRPEWPNSPVMWDTVKAQKELTDFVLLFDHTQKLGKNITSRSASTSSTETAPGKRRRSVPAVNPSEMQENCELRDKLYAEFYSVLSETFKNGVAPVTSSIYDNVVTKEFVTKNMELFKSVALKLPSTSYVPTPVSKKRRAPPGAPKKIAAKQRRDTKPPSPVYASDNTQDTNMSE